VKGDRAEITGKREDNMEIRPMFSST